jgi:hypothetical protein
MGNLGYGSSHYWNGGFFEDPTKRKGGKISIPGSTVMKLLDIKSGSEEYHAFYKGCVGLAGLRLNTELEPFSIKGTRAFKTLAAAIEAQKEMVKREFAIDLAGIIPA